MLNISTAVGGKEATFIGGNNTYFIPKMISHTKLVEGIVDSVSPGGDIRVGVVCNTVVQAQNLYGILRSKTNDASIRLIHSRFTVRDRNLIEETVVDSVGRGAESEVPTIIIGTQVIEQSLDIDFDVIYTDNAPMSLIIQRAGRLHRHSGRSRNHMHRHPYLFVVMHPKSMLDATHYRIYSEYELESTARFFSRHGIKPVYSDKTREILEDISSFDDPEINELRDSFISINEQTESRADSIILGSVKMSYRNNMFDIFENKSDEDLTVRDITDTVSVYLLNSHSIEMILNRDCDIMELLNNSEVSLPVQFNDSVDDIYSKERPEVREVINKVAGKYSLPYLLTDDSGCITVGDTKLLYDSLVGLRKE